ncbi:hypothetical protein VO419_004390 [Vibrio parahaemolyticus]|nr:hypothetical protein [Vibrio parahaemolyticus]
MRTLTTTIIENGNETTFTAKTNNFIKTNIRRTSERRELSYFCNYAQDEKIIYRQVMLVDCSLKIEMNGTMFDCEVEIILNRKQRKSHGRDIFKVVKGNRDSITSDEMYALRKMAIELCDERTKALQEKFN